MPGVRHSKREGRPVSPAATEFESATRRAIFYAKFTIGYNVIEGIVAVSAGVGLTIQGISELRLTGTFKARFVWAD